MFADIVVKTKIPSIGKSYSYRVPEELKKTLEIGKTVEVPFGRENKEGIVFSITSRKPDFETKEIKMLSPKPSILDKKGLDLAMWMSKHYCANFFDCISIMLPRKGNLIKEEEISTSKLEKPLKLTSEQEVAMNKIKAILYNKSLNKRILLHGVTGSGKTEIYLQTTDLVLGQGKQVLFMVPEISLTPQLIQRFSSRFGKEKIAIVHSHLSKGIRAKSWNDIKEGKKQIIVGSRSAILSPFKNLGAIIIDECHEQSYKQDSTPRYNAIDIAKYLNRRDGSLLLMGSATPLIEQYYEATHSNDDELITLKEKISKNESRNLVINTKLGEPKNKYPIISNTLQGQINLALTKSEQVLLYLNRRGIASALICSKCGSYEKCPKCDSALTIHSKGNKNILVCHYCFFTKDLVDKCSVCSSPFIRAFGYGTEILVNQIKELFPKANVIRMDKDTTSKKGSHESIFNQFKNKEADILVGTQMITKGWDISNISLTGYILLETDLFFPSFRTSERVYSLITQLAGRGGRGNKPSINIIQTLNPDNPILRDALDFNYEDFYAKELLIRHKLNYPPYSNLVQIVSKDKKEVVAIKRLKQTISAIKKALSSINSRLEIDMLGPSRCFVPKMKNEYFFQVTYKVSRSKNDIYLERFIEVLNGIKKTNGININISPFDLQ